MVSRRKKSKNLSPSPSPPLKSTSMHLTMVPLAARSNTNTNASVMSIGSNAFVNRIHNGGHLTRQSTALLSKEASLDEQIPKPRGQAMKNSLSIAGTIALLCLKYTLLYNSNHFQMYSWSSGSVRRNKHGLFRRNKVESVASGCHVYATLGIAVQLTTTSIQKVHSQTSQ
jgi:hypothetical protein